MGCINCFDLKNGSPHRLGRACLQDGHYFRITDFCLAESQSVNRTCLQSRNRRVGKEEEKRVVCLTAEPSLQPGTEILEERTMVATLGCLPDNIWKTKTQKPPVRDLRLI